MEYDTSKSKELKKDFKTALNMTPIERTISFLNNYFIYKKVRTVDVKSVTKSILTKGVIEEEQIGIQEDILENITRESNQQKDSTFVIKKKHKKKLKLVE